MPNNISSLPWCCGAAVFGNFYNDACWSTDYSKYRNLLIRRVKILSINRSGRWLISTVNVNMEETRKTLIELGFKFTPYKNNSSGTMVSIGYAYCGDLTKITRSDSKGYF